MKQQIKALLAAWVLFTRLPAWRITTLTATDFQRAITYWPLTGWGTSAVAAGVLYGGSALLPSTVAVLLALTSRVLLTGAMHEDGLSDFLDGFGGGVDRERTLEIMKDSRTGSYGVVGLILYVGLWCLLLSSLPVEMACVALLCGDPFAKFVASTVVNQLSYARPASESKTQIVYQRMSHGALGVTTFWGLAPLGLWLSPLFWLAGVGTLLCVALLIGWMRRRLGGFTGDCCGALFALGELAFYLGIVVLWNWKS